jgi:hypothetical protein
MSFMSAFLDVLFFRMKPRKPLKLVGPLASGEIGVAYASGNPAIGGKPPYTYSIGSGSLPPGLSQDAVTGRITGTPTTAGTYGFVRRVVDAQGSIAQQLCSIQIVGLWAISDLPGDPCEHGIAYYTQAPITGGVYPLVSIDLSTGALPSGLTLGLLDESGYWLWTITGTPSVDGTFNFTVRVTDSNGGVSTRACTLEVAAHVSLAQDDPDGTVGVAYTGGVRGIYGVPPYAHTLFSGALPAGCSLDADTGDITGSPTTFDSYTFTIHVLDSVGATASSTMTIDVNPAAVGLTFNSADKHSSVTLSNGDADATFILDAPWHSVRSNAGKSTGKWYAELLITASGTGGDQAAGIANSSMPLTGYVGSDANAWGFLNDGYKTHSGYSAYGTTAWFGNGAVLMIAFDADNGKVWFGANGTWFASGNPATGANPTHTGVTTGVTYYLAACAKVISTVRVNGLSTSYTPPSGFSPWTQ